MFWDLSMGNANWNLGNVKMRKFIILFAVFAVKSTCATWAAYIDDGASHTIADDTYANVILKLDSNRLNVPGTHVDLIDGGSVYALGAHNNASITMSGGEVFFELAATDNSSVTMSGGSITLGDLESRDNGAIFMTGGSVSNDLVALDNSTITMSGGTVKDDFYASINGTIYLKGTDFQVNGQPLSFGDKVSDFGTMVESRRDGIIRDYWTGTITGILTDGTSLNNTFEIYNTGVYSGTADIIIIPEPTTLLLLGLGGLILSKKR